MKKEVFAIIGVILNVIILIDLLFKFTWIHVSVITGVIILFLSFLALGFSITLFFKDSKFFKIPAILVPILLIILEITFRLTTKSLPPI